MSMQYIPVKLLKSECISSITSANLPLSISYLSANYIECQNKLSKFQENCCKRINIHIDVYNFLIPKSLLITHYINYCIIEKIKV